METMMTEKIQQLLKNLRLRKMAEIVEGELATARKTSPSYTSWPDCCGRSGSINRKEGYNHASSTLTCPSVDLGVVPLQAATRRIAPPDP